MGQLEKYGLYVLCLVIFLILGVAIWGGDPAGAQGLRQQVVNNQRGGNQQGGVGLRTAQIKPLDQIMHQVDLDDGLQPSLRDGAARGAAGNPNGGPRSSDQFNNGDLGSNRYVDGSERDNNTGSGNGAPVDRNDANMDSRPAGTSGSRETYKIREGDSFARIAQRKFGNERLYLLIGKLNPKVDPSKLSIDQEIVLPSKDDVAGFLKKSAKASGARIYTVRKGDSLWNIASRELKDGSRYLEILKLNPGLKADELSPDQVIKLPPSR